MLDTTRIASVLDLATLAGKIVVLVGVGGGSFEARQFVRSGILQLRLVDPQQVDSENICRQVYQQSDVGKLKVEATKEALLAIEPEAVVQTFSLDVTNLSEDEEREIFADADLVLGLTDNHIAQSATSRLARKYQAAFMAVGIYARGVGGEVFWNRADAPVCYRCMFSHRYKSQLAAKNEGRSLDPPSDGAPIFVGSIIDAMAGNIALSLLTEGADNFYGRFLSRLGNRQLLVTKFDPDWETSPGRDIVRDELGISSDNECYFAYNTIAMAPSDAAKATPCPDCLEFRRQPAL